MEDAASRRAGDAKAGSVPLVKHPWVCGEHRDESLASVSPHPNSLKLIFCGRCLMLAEMRGRVNAARVSDERLLGPPFPSGCPVGSRIPATADDCAPHRARDADDANSPGRCCSGMEPIGRIVEAPAPKADAAERVNDGGRHHYGFGGLDLLRPFGLVALLAGLIRKTSRLTNSKTQETCCH